MTILLLTGIVFSVSGCVGNQTKAQTPHFNFRMADGSKAPDAQYKKDAYECRKEAALAHPEIPGNMVPAKRAQTQMSLMCMEIRGYKYTVTYK